MSNNMGIRLIVGLANPGKQYANTRHNVGAWFLHELAQQQGLSLAHASKFHGLSACYFFSDSQCYLLEPSTFMNHSGQSVRSAAQFYKLSPQEILVVHDELDFEPGVIRLKYGGGHGGHNGLRDIISELKTPDFHRIRIGIGHPGSRDQVTPYVLGQPNKVDKERIVSAIEEGLRIVDELIQGHFEKAMRYLHA